MNACKNMRVADTFSLGGAGGLSAVHTKAPQNIWLGLAGFTLAPGLAKNSLVARGTLVATSPEAHKGDLHSPIDGFIADAGAEGLLISTGLPKVKEGENIEPLPAVQPIDLTRLDSVSLPPVLKSLGLDQIQAGHSFKHLIFNGLNPEPGILWAEYALTHDKENLLAGIRLFKTLYPHAEFTLACAPGHLGTHQEAYTALGLQVREITGDYPASLNELVAFAVTGKELPADVAMVSLHTLWAYGRVAESAMPLTESLLSAGESIYVAPIGLAAQSLAAEAGLTVEAGDSLIFGGPMRGTAQTRLHAGIGKHTYGLCVLPAQATPLMEGDDACVNCGLCVAACPARLQPHKITRNAEFGLYNQNDALAVQSCFECGLCGYVCMARRPMLQYIRLGKSESAVAAPAFAGLCI